MRDIDEHRDAQAVRQIASALFKPLNASAASSCRVSANPMNIRPLAAAARRNSHPAPPGSHPKGPAPPTIVTDANTLVEIVEAAHLHLGLDERAIPVREDIRGACEILGPDPMYVANEGRFVCFVPAAEAQDALIVMRSQKLGEVACQIGEVSAVPTGLVALQSHIGVSRVVDMLSGEQLPRIC